MSHVTHLECSLTGERYRPDALHNLSRAGKPLLVRYDLAAIARAVSKEAIARRPPSLWRYLEFLPLRSPEQIVSLGEVMTPLVPLVSTQAQFGGGEILVKDEGRMPTGSFKARGLSMAVAMAKALGVWRIGMPTSGNAGAALAAYAMRAGIEAIILCPEDATEVVQREIAFHGARTYLVNGIISDCGELISRGAGEGLWFDFSTLKEPYRIEGKKTMALELAEQLGWDVPDVIFYPTGGGTGLIGMWKAFGELVEIGWITRRPRLVAVQSTGCGPLVKAFEEGADEVREPWSPVTTTIHGVRVPKPFGDFLCLRVLYESGGFAEAVDDETAHAARAEIAHTEGVHLGPEGAACLVAYRQSLDKGRVSSSDRVVIFNCGNGYKNVMPPVTARLDRHTPIDLAAL